MANSLQPGVAALAVALAIAACYVALFLASRTSGSRGGAGRLWIGGAGVALGMGTWSTHFVGMVAWDAPFALVYNPWLELAALLLATAVFAGALRLTAWQPRPGFGLVPGALLLATGILVVEFIGLAALSIEPAPRLDGGHALAAVAAAIVGSLLAVGLDARLGERPQWQGLTRIAAAVMLGAAVTATHYLALSGLQFAADAVAGPGTTLHAFWLAVTIAAIAFAMLSMTAVFMILDDHMAARTRRHTAQLAEVNARLRHAALHDSLTGLPNRVLLGDRLEQAIASAAERNVHCAVMIVDLDRFAAINDSLGHQAGDRVLCTAAQRIQSVLRPTDTLARMGGDEFVVLRDDVSGATEVDELAQAIYRVVAPPIDIDGTELQIGCSAGIVLYPQGGTDSATLLRHADTAMSHAKREGRARYSFYQPQMDRFARERLEIESGLRRALVAGEFVLHYQPRIDVGSGRVHGAEALMRWQHPQRGLVPPGEFIPVAEETGLISPMTEWALREATGQLQRWKDAGLSQLQLSVNLSAALLGHPQLEGLVLDAVNAAGIDPSQLELELTESAVMRDPERSIQVLRSLARRGLRISVDDFGTGYSSLSYLRRLPLHALKVDRSFIRDVVTNHEDAEITRAIISLAHSLKLRVTAEGVETDRQLAFLRALGCDEYQGFLASAAVPAEQFASYVQQSLSATQRLRMLGQRARNALRA